MNSGLHGERVAPSTSMERQLFLKKGKESVEGCMRRVEGRTWCVEFRLEDLECNVVLMGLRNAEFGKLI